MRFPSITLALFALSLPAMAADSSNWLGTWKLNTSKSTFEGTPAVQKETVTFKQDGAKTMRQARGTDVNGNTLEGDGHNESFPWDGKFHVVSTPADGINVEVSVKIEDENHLTVMIKMNGKLHSTTHSTLSSNGKTDTYVEDGLTMNGAKFHKVAIYEKQ